MRNRVDSSLSIEPASPVNSASWLKLRGALWPDTSKVDHEAELARILRKPDRGMAFLALTPESECVGFAEASLRSDYVNGCATSPAGFLEGIFVEPAHRGNGYARALIQKVEDWLVSRGCSEFASDALVGNLISHKMHRALGFEETERVVFFRKPLVARRPRG
jgi:aminoglycoside 6'-N-acetyltransferase I